MKGNLKAATGIVFVFLYNFEVVEVFIFLKVSLIAFTCYSVLINGASNDETKP